ncbi:MAG: nuclear transport factor 2 family protein [Dehalococcoidales bacterium]
MKQSPDIIRKATKALENAIENKNVAEVLASFADDCEIELLRQRLFGKEGVRKWLDWLYKNLWQIKFQPIVIVVKGTTLFEEFIVRARLHSGVEIKSKQAQVVVYENDKIKSLRLYFDRLDFAESVTKDLVSKAAVNRIIKKSLAGLVD